MNRGWECDVPSYVRCMSVCPVGSSRTSVVCPTMCPTTSDRQWTYASLPPSDTLRYGDDTLSDILSDIEANTADIGTIHYRYTTDTLPIHYRYTIRYTIRYTTDTLPIHYRYRDDTLSDILSDIGFTPLCNTPNKLGSPSELRPKISAK